VSALRIFWFCLLLLVSAAALAADLSITVTDPKEAVVAGARVLVYRSGRTQPVGMQTTAADGRALFSGLASGQYGVEVLAPGFAKRLAQVVLPQESPLRLKLAVAPAAQTVVVSATLTPVPEEEAGGPVASLDHETLDNLQPGSAAEALRFLPGAIVNTTGRRGGQASLFVRGGESRYNKVILDGVPVNDPGGFFDFGVVPLQEVERMEFVRGAVSSLYGSDAMTSIVQVWTATGRTRMPELRFGADGGTFSTVHGFASLAGARGRLDYELFADQVNTEGQGVNDKYSNSSQGGNVGILLARHASLRLHSRHSNNRNGVASNWNFNGQPLLPPDSDQFARQNNFLASADLFLAATSRWQHRLSGFEYRHQRLNLDRVADRGCDFASFVFLDCPFSVFAKVNRAGFDYQGEYSPRSWSTTTFGYRFEDENGHSGETISGSNTHGLRRNHGLYGEQILTLPRFSLVAGLRWEHNQSFGDKAVPRIAATFLVRRGGDQLSGTRLRFAYGQGIKAPSFEEAFGIAAFLILPNPQLKAEENRSLEAGIQQSLLGGRFSVSAAYFNNLFRNQITCCTPVDPVTGSSRFFNINRSFAHGSELEFHARPRRRLRVDASYSYTSTQILRAPLALDPLFAAGAPLLRRPRHSGAMIVGYSGNRWGTSLAGTFVGRRPDSDFTFGAVPPVNHAAGYARFDPGAWYAINHYTTAYVNIGNLFNRHYEEVSGYPALRLNFRAGMRFRLGGE